MIAEALEGNYDLVPPIVHPRRQDSTRITVECIYAFSPPPTKLAPKQCLSNTIPYLGNQPVTYPAPGLWLILLSTLPEAKSGTDRSVSPATATASFGLLPKAELIFMRSPGPCAH